MLPLPRTSLRNDPGWGTTANARSTPAALPCRGGSSPRRSARHSRPERRVVSYQTWKPRRPSKVDPKGVQTMRGGPPKPQRALRSGVINLSVRMLQNRQGLPKGRAPNRACLGEMRAEERNDMVLKTVLGRPHRSRPANRSLPALVALTLAQSAEAGCQDPSRPRVDWDRLLQETPHVGRRRPD